MLKVCDFFGRCPTSAAVSRCGTWAPVELPHVSQKQANVGHQAKAATLLTMTLAAKDTVSLVLLEGRFRSVKIRRSNERHKHPRSSPSRFRPSEPSCRQDGAGSP